MTPPASPYALRMQPSAERDLRALPADIRQRADARIRALPADPRPSGAKKLAGPVPGYRVRDGDYRILYAVDDEARTVTIGRVRHRSDVYR